MYNPQYLIMPTDIYSRSREIAGAYLILLKRREVFLGAEYATKINEWQIHAIENAWQTACRDEHEVRFISKNVFEGLPMQYIDEPISYSGMKRCRKRFFHLLAENLGFIAGERKSRHEFVKNSHNTWGRAESADEEIVYQKKEMVEK